MGIQILERNDRIDIFRHSFGTLVAVGDCIADRKATFINQDKVHAPGVDADRLRNLANISGSLASEQHVTGK